MGDFILQNLEAIVGAWEEYARAHWPGETPTPAELRDNALPMLRAVAADMKSAQSRSEQKQKSEGDGKENPVLDRAALQHAHERLSAGFDVVQVVERIMKNQPYDHLVQEAAS